MTDIVSEDYDELLEGIIILIDNLIMSEPMLYAKPKFHDIIIDEVTNLIQIQLEDTYKPDYLIKRAVNEGMRHYYTVHNPRRSYNRSIILKLPNVIAMTAKLNYLKNIPQPEQRTNEWYLFRQTVLTASSIWKAYGSEKAKNQIIYDKCEPVDLEKYNRVNMESPMHWGQKYEDVSIEWYENHYNTKVTEFGCIPHKHIPYLAASPDGINTDINSKRYGRMLEVKNIFNREITGIPKLEYWIQMQVQMEVCNLNECDFLETRFIEYESYNDFMSDGCFNFTETENIKGIIICFIQNEKPIYEYAPLYQTIEQYEVWEQATMEKHREKVWLRNMYWKLDEISCVLVLRNKFWFNSTKHVLKDIWDSIEKERVSGHQHRAPNTRKKAEEVKEKTCSIILNNGVATIVNKNNQEPVINEPVILEPVIPEPVIPEPVILEPVILEPVIPEPVIPEPVINEPVKENIILQNVMALPAKRTITIDI